MAVGSRFGKPGADAHGYVALILHAHLPFVRHPEHADCLEERWLFEAITESYLPLLAMLERLACDQIPFRLTLSLSPTLMAMLDDPLLRDRYQRYLEASLELAAREVALLAGRQEAAVAQFYRHRLRNLHTLYTVRYRRDLVQAFHRLAKAGYIDLITSAATHGFLPLLRHQPEMVRAQVLVAAAEFRRRFGHPPRGFWLPECGYFPGLDRALQEASIQFCCVESHALAHGRPAAPRATYSHVWTPRGLALFGRDRQSSHQVWSVREGYPGDGAYREFYRDIGFEREPSYLGSLAAPPGSRSFTGLKYHRVTGPTEQKDWYDRLAAEQTAARHAGHFLSQRRQQIAQVQGALPDGPPPLIVAPYDAELFGHWWFEGPDFLDQVARQATAQRAVRFITPGDYLDLFPGGQGVLEPAYSSWGDAGYADFWCDGPNHWIYRHLNSAGRRMVALARWPPPAAPHMARALNQAARELLLAQASDWPFIMRAGTAVTYAQGRFQAHIGRFRRIADGLAKGEAPDLGWLAKVEAADNLFPDLHYQLFRSH